MIPLAAQVDGVAVSDSALDLSRAPYTIASAGARRFFAADALCEGSTDHGGLTPCWAISTTVALEHVVITRVLAAESRSESATMICWIERSS